MADTSLSKRPGIRSLTGFQDAMSDLFSRFFEGWDIMPTFEGRTWWPLLDVVEHGDEYLVKADVPGMKAEDIELSIEGNILTISGRKNQEKEEKGENYYYSERRYGDFRRDITLPSTVDSDKIEAAVENGVLCITLPKSEAARPKKIKVQEHALTT
ncbi:MAG: Hsp20/alpha crystallin family protein [Phycisphaerae bacterium]